MFDGTSRIINEPCFLVGAERSGTTLLRLMLDQHPELAFHSEFEFAVDLVPKEGWPDVQEYAAWLGMNRAFRVAGYNIDKSLTYPELVNSFLLQKRDQSGKRLVGATVHRHFDTLHRIWPQARFIHIVRDGRDVARSRIAMGWAGNVWVGVEEWIELESQWEELKTVLHPKRRIEVRYEQLVAQAEKTLQSICIFIGIQYHPAMLEYHRTSTYDMPNPRLIDQWKRKLSKRDIQLVESRAGVMLKNRGYCLSKYRIISVGPREERRLRRQHRWATRLFRIRKYGFWLVLFELATRRIKMRRLNKRIELRLQEITNQHLK